MEPMLLSDEEHQCPFNGCNEKGFPIDSCQFLKDSKTNYHVGRCNEYRKCFHAEDGNNYFLKYKQPKTEHIHG